MGEVQTLTLLEPAKKRRFTRSKDGCITCRIRKIKCSLERPSCVKCTSTGRKCDGYAPQAQTHQLAAQETQGSRLADPQRALENPVSLACTPCERLCLDFFYRVSAPSYVKFGSYRFWNSLVIQACFYETAIKHLVLAATTLDLCQQGRMDGAKSSLAFAIHYGTALNLLASVKNPQPAVLLMACLLFVLCDEYRNDRSGVQQHLSAGRRIVQSLDGKSRANVSTELEELAPLFKRLDVQTETLEFPFFAGAHCIYSADGDLSRKPSTHTDVRQPSYTKGFSSIGSAAHCLQLLAPMCLKKTKDEIDYSRADFHILPEITAHLNRWLQGFNDMLTHLTPEESVDNTNEINLLRSTFMCLHILSRYHCSGREGAYDKDTDAFFKGLVNQFNTIISRDAPDSLLERALSPLFFIAAHCRSPDTRRRAVDLLNDCSWPGKRIARVAEQIIKLEEGTSWIESSTDVPATRRIRVLDISFASVDPDASSSHCVLSYTRPPFDATSKLTSTFLWEDLPPDAALQESVMKLLRRVMGFEMIAFDGR